MISVIIPTLNEERALPRTLALLAAQDFPHETVICDGGSTDTTSLVANQPGVQWITAQRGRGAQMNAGAQAARGEWLLFLHADTLLPTDALEAIAALPPQIKVGCFHQAFNDTHLLLRLVSRLHNWRCKRTKIIYGDQAMFVRRQLFNALGGFPETDLEDVKFSERLRLITVPEMLPATVVTDARKFLAHGVLRSVARIILLLLCHHHRLPLQGRHFFDPVR